MNKEELDKLKRIEKCFEDAYYSVMHARGLMRLLEEDYNSTSEGFTHFVSQLRNYYMEYSRRVNTLYRNIAERYEEVVKKGGTENQ